jgi:hypothetical protein
MAFTGRITGSRELQSRLRSMGELRPTLTRVGLASVAEAKRLVPRRTGNLGRTIRLGEVTSDHVDVVAGGRLSVGYAAAVEFGTRAHTIVPRKAKVLAWGGPRTLGGRLRTGGKPQFFAKRVHHPGSRAKPYLIPGLHEGVRSITGLIIDAWNRGA